MLADGLVARSMRFAPGGVEIISNIDISFRKGELTALLGPNGAGKSTLLKLLSGDIACKSGEVLYGNERMKDLTIKELARRRCVLPQESFLSFAFSVREVVSLGDLEEDSQDIVEECLNNCGLADMAERSYLTLSGGQKQRCQMARVLVQIYDSIGKGFFPVVFLDEPTASMDMAHQHHILKTGRELAQKDLCVVVVLHDLTLASQYAQRVVIMKDGQIYDDGPVNDVMTVQMVQDVYEYAVDVICHKDNLIVIPISAM